MDKLRREAIAAIASEDRRHWFGGYAGPPADLIHTVVENLGFRIVYDDLGTKHGELDLDRGVIRINSTLFERLNHKVDLNAVEAFTLGHELAHNSLHGYRLQRGLPLGPEHELEADFYAGVLLMPRRRILESHEWTLLEEKFSWPPCYRLAERYKVSPKAMQIRIEELKKAGPLPPPPFEPRPPAPEPGGKILLLRGGANA